jgi:hypothetical protein
VELDARARAAHLELRNQQSAATALSAPSSGYESAGAQNRIRVAAMRYNAAASALAVALDTFPSRWLAFGMRPRPLFALDAPPAADVEPAATSAPAIDDRAGLFEPEERAALDKEISLLRAATGIDVRVVAERSGAGTIEDRAGSYFDRGAIGASDGRGLLIFYDLATRALRIELGYELERHFSDADAGRLVREHARYLFDADDPAFSLLLTLRMLESRMVRAFFAGEFDPQVRADRAAPELRGGAGATDVAPLGTHTLVAFPPARVTGRASRSGAAQTPHDVYAQYLDWLASGRFDPDASVFTRESRAFLRRWPMTPAYLAWMLALERGQSFEIARRGDRALLYCTSDPYLAPRFLVRSAEGWQLDVLAELRHVVRIRGGAYFWSLREPEGEALRELRDLIVPIDGLARLSRSDNRPFDARAAPPGSSIR